MELPHHVLVLAGLPDVLDQAGVVDVGAVEPDAEGLSAGDGSGAEGLHHLAGSVAPVAGAERGQRQQQRRQVQTQSQGRSAPPVYPHPGPAAEDNPYSPGDSSDPSSLSQSLIIRLFPFNIRG